jgi:hypothetical protein
MKMEQSDWFSEWSGLGYMYLVKSPPAIIINILLTKLVRSGQGDIVPNVFAFLWTLLVARSIQIYKSMTPISPYPDLPLDQ